MIPMSTSTSWPRFGGSAHRNHRRPSVKGFLPSAARRCNVAISNDATALAYVEVLADEQKENEPVGFLARAVRLVL